VNLAFNDILFQDKFPTRTQFRELTSKAGKSHDWTKKNGDDRCPVMHQKSKKGAKEREKLQRFNPVFDFGEEVLIHREGRSRTTPLRM
jgi:hypothetical protein